MAKSAKELFEQDLPKGLAAHTEQAKEIGAIYQFNITGDGGGTWVVDLSKDKDWVSSGPSDASQVTIETSAEDWSAIISGELNAMQAFMMGRLRVSGDMALATRLQTLFEMMES